MSLPALALPAGRTRAVTRARARVAGLAGVAFLGFFTVLALFGTRLAPYRAGALSGPSLEAPSRAHVLGTNLLGQDIASQLIVGARASLVIAALAGVGTVLLGGVVGVTAGWFRGWVDVALMRATDVVLVVPKLPLLLLVGALTGGRVLSLSLLIAVTFWPVTARVLRSQVLSLRTRTHVRAATGFGAGTWHQLRHHILPDLALLSVAELIPAASRAVALQAGLAFLGVGDPNEPTWGGIIRDALSYRSIFLIDAWKWWLVPPIAAIVVLITGITFLGTAGEHRLSPRLSRHNS